MYKENTGNAKTPENIGKMYLGGEGQSLKDPWGHRSNGMSCQTCMWYVPKQRDQAYMYAEGAPPQPITTAPPIIGRCRRHAPTMNGYPVVYPNDWCGDHKLDENKA